MAIENEKQLLSVKEVSEILGFGISTIWRHVNSGDLPEPIKIGGSTRWRKAEIEAIFEPFVAE